MRRRRGKSAGSGALVCGRVACVAQHLLQRLVVRVRAQAGLPLGAQRGKAARREAGGVPGRARRDEERRGEQIRQRSAQAAPGQALSLRLPDLVRTPSEL